MPFVFKISALILVSATVGGQFFQGLDAAPNANKVAEQYRAECPAMQGPAKIVTKGDEVRFYDAYGLQVVTGAIGLGNGCAAS